MAWSENSVDSTWCRAEATEGLDRDILVPIRIADVRPPLAFRASQTASLIGWPGHPAEIQMLIAGIEAALESAPAHTKDTDTDYSEIPSVKKRFGLALSIAMVVALSIGLLGWFVLSEDRSVSSARSIALLEFNLGWRCRSHSMVC